MQSATIEGFRLSPQQEHLWRLHPNGDASAYRARCTVRIDGNLDVTRLREALATVVDRHEILRTSFQRLPAMEMPLQVVDQESQVDLSLLAPNPTMVGVVNGTANSTGNGSTNGVYTNGTGSNGPVSNGPVSNGPASNGLASNGGHNDSQMSDAASLRATLEKRDASQHLLHLSLPSLYADAIGLEKLVSEIATSYGAISNGAEAALDEDALQYIDLADWQNELLESAHRLDHLTGCITW